MERILSILITVVVTGLFLLIISFFSKGLAWNKVKRSLDMALSRSHISQIVILGVVIVFVFILLVLLSFVINPIKGDGQFSLRLWSVLSHFFNPGGFSKECVDNKSVPNGWIFFINVFGMILMTGLLISVLSNLLERRVDNLKNGRIYYNFKNHFVIIGYDKMTISLINQLAEENSGKDIILQTVQDVPYVRHELFSYLSKDIEENVFILSGNRNSKEDLEKLSIKRAEKIFILGEKDEYDHDSLNIECLKKINVILHEKNESKIKLLIESIKTKINWPVKADPQPEVELKPCYVLFENQSTYAILQRQDLMSFLKEENRDSITVKDDEKDKESSGNTETGNNGEDIDNEERNVSKENNKKEKVIELEFIPFNFQELWAQKVFVDDANNCPDDKTENIKYLPLDREGINYKSEETVHLVIMGMSKMGVALGVQASHLCHFPNFIRDEKLKTKITFIDENADREFYFLKGRYRHLFKEIDYSYEDTYQPENSFNNYNDFNTKLSTSKFTDVEWNFVKGRIEAPAIQEKLISYSKENTYLTIAICLNLPAAAIASGLYLPEEVYGSDIQILVKQDTPYSILSMLKTTEKYKNVKPFGMLDNSLDLSKTNDDIPIIIKYIYDSYFGELKQVDAIPSGKELQDLYDGWKGLKTVKKWSNRYNADMIDVKQRSFNLTPETEIDEETEDLLAKVEHNRWNVEELLLGYRPTNNEEKVEIGKNRKIKDEMKNIFVHNDICPYDDISDVDIVENDDNKVINNKEYDICLSKALPMIIKYKHL